MLINADCGGSNGARLRLWKRELQVLANELGIEITVCHVPPGTSKWNKVEHRLFSFITQNWRGKPLVSYLVIVQLIASTTTGTGLTVACRLDENDYEKGIKVTDAEMAALNIQPAAFHGEWNYIPQLDGNPDLQIPPRPTLLPPMIRPSFLDSESRCDLIDLARDGAAAHRLARRANALVLLDDGLSCEAIGKVLFLDGDTIREWHKLYLEDGIEGLATFNHEGGSCRLAAEQQDKLKAWIGTALPRTTREVGAWITAEFGIEYQTRSGLIALLHRLGMEHRKPKAISRKLDPAKQAAFIKGYEDLMKRIFADEAVIFADAAHPTHAVRPVGCWAPKEVPVAVEQSSGRDRLNIHGAIDLETGQTIIKDVLTVDA